MDPAISVILPTRNRAPLLQMAVDSVLNQSFQNFELILVDDSSEDNTPDVIRSLSDPRIRSIRTLHPRGAAGARNAGLEKARASFIAFHDSDDNCRTDKLQRQMDLFDTLSPEVGVVYTRYTRETNGHSYIEPAENAPLTDGNIFNAMLVGNLVGTPTALIRKTVIDRCGGFDEKLKVLVDWEFFLRVAQSFQFRLIPEVLYFSKVRKDSVSARHEDYARAFIHILNEFSADFTQHPRLLASHYGTLAHRFYCAGLKNEGRDYYRRALRLRPTYPAYWAGWLAGYCLPFYFQLIRFNKRKQR